jgi:hypothetical protein
MAPLDHLPTAICAARAGGRASNTVYRKKHGDEMVVTRWVISARESGFRKTWYVSPKERAEYVPCIPEPPPGGTNACDSHFIVRLLCGIVGVLWDTGARLAEW